MSYTNVDPALKKRIKELRMEYGENPQPELLIALPNPQVGVDYTVSTEYPEFTSLCPLAATQPDYATILLQYKPAEKTVELKSLKFYYVSYRDVEIFHESVPTQILKDLVAALSPAWMTVTATFSVRGGIETVVEAKYGC